MTIQLSTVSDLPSICSIHRSAFGEEEQESIVQLVTEFLTEESAYDVLSFLYTEDGIVSAHVIFSHIKCAEHFERAYILAPLAVLQSCQKKGIAAEIVRHGLAHLESIGAELVCVYGSPQYYSRFGFQQEGAELSVPPYALRFPQGWQCLTLNGATLPSAAVNFTCAPPLAKPELW
ncbi:MAG: N-acetyltransferase [Planctomycetes bacterium]|nr:N-acetyltransferase [Planctomycetota bacterium]